MVSKQHLIKQDILTVLEKAKTVDCHSHTRLKGEYYEKGPYDLFSLTSYFERDINSTAGGPIYKGAKSDETRWLRLKKVLNKSRNVSYWRHNLVVYQKLFGLKEEELTDGNWQKVNKTIHRKTKEKSWYDHVTNDLCNLETQVRNIPWFESWEEKYFTAVLRMEPALELHNAETLNRLEEHLNMSIKDLETVKLALHKLVKEYVDKGAVGIKLAHAYNRSLHSVSVSDRTASRIFNRAIGKHNLSDEEVKKLQDHIIFFLAELAREMKLVFQIHTGVQGNWGNVPDSDPLLLIPLLKAFPDVRFDLFHAGYPYSRMLGMLGKHYPNVWLNMAWMYIISTAASRQLLSEWLDLVPGYRVLGFGSDVKFPEMILGHLEIARSCVADVLAEKVEKDFLSKEEAMSLAQRMFRDNGMELYGLGKEK